ncbi:NADH-quinone oxidoreductase subunit J [Nitratidesulfovibrio sp.]|uniref:NADH-quinone oxidoreductase subunit J family protein n=1 Tax=Nitratidesulfovibrio sp. TaxID=2802297 RepID=UPI003341089F
METLAILAFGFYFLVIVVGCFMAVGCASLVRALVGLVATLLGVAGMYLLLNAPFMAFMQILIYVGAICVLIFFALMLARADAGGDEADPAPAARTFKGVLAAMLPGALLAPILMLHPTASRLVPAEVPLAELGRRLMEDYVLPFELISVVLLISMAGAVLLVWERRDK